MIYEKCFVNWNYVYSSLSFERVIEYVFGKDSYPLRGSQGGM